ncbi:MAG: hypothetical protein ACFFEN_12245 [Candidatus Thorarchaeota archaeon]
MIEKEKPSQEIEEIEIKDPSTLNLSQCYKKLTKAISTKNAQSIYGLSKIITRYHLEN